MPLPALTKDERAVLTAYGTDRLDIPAIVAKLRLPHSKVSNIIVNLARVDRTNARRITADTSGQPQPQPQPATMPALTPRERQALQHAAAGHNGPEIANLMQISQWTVNEHLQAAYAKLGTRRRGDAIQTALALGLVTIAPTAAAVANQSANPEPVKPLSPREHAILRLYCEGRSAIEVGARLGMAPSTVRSHLRRIYDKLGVVSRSQAISVANQIGLLDVKPERRRTEAAS